MSHSRGIVCLITLVIVCGGCAKLRPKQSADGKWGYINQSGEFVIKPKFDTAADFHEGLACVGILEPVYRLPKTTYESGYSIEQLKYGYIDSTGSYIVAPYYDYADDFEGGRARVGRDDSYLIAQGEFFSTRFGYIDKNGHVVEPLE